MGESLILLAAARGTRKTPYPNGTFYQPLIRYVAMQFSEIYSAAQTDELRDLYGAFDKCTPPQVHPALLWQVATSSLFARMEFNVSQRFYEHRTVFALIRCLKRLDHRVPPWTPHKKIDQSRVYRMAHRISPPL
jgi:hypothetical protein